MGYREFEIQFCQRVFLLREKERMSWKALSQKSGISLELLKQLEQNVLPEELMVNDAFALAEVFHCKVSELFR